MYGVPQAAGQVAGAVPDRWKPAVLAASGTPGSIALFRAKQGPSSGPSSRVKANRSRLSALARLLSLSATYQFAGYV